MYNNIRTPGQLQPTATFYLFKDHIEPKWEDPKNVNGGCWTASVPSKGPNSKAQLDAWWLHGVSEHAASTYLGMLSGAIILSIRGGAQHFPDI